MRRYITWPALDSEVAFPLELDHDVAKQLTVSSGGSGLEGHDADGGLSSGTGAHFPARVFGLRIGAARRV